MDVRPTTEADLDQVIQLFWDVAAEGRWIATEVPFDREERRQRIAATIASADGENFVAVEGDQVVGTLGINRAPYGVAEFGMMVADGWRGRGVGTALLEAAIDWARSVGAHKVALQAWPDNEAAIGLYRKLGFEVEGLLRQHYRRRNGDLRDAVVMGLLL